MSDTPDFSTFNWPNSQQTSNADPADPTSYSQHASFTTQPSQHPSDSFHHDSPPINGSSNTGPGADSSSLATGGPAARGDNSSSSDYANFTFGQPSGASGTQSDSQGGYYSINGGIDPSQTSYGADAAGGYGPIDPALTAAPARGGAGGGNSFSHGNTSQSSGAGSSYLQHIPPTNFNQGRRYSVPAISSTATAPYSVPKRQNMYPPGIYGNRSSLDPALTSSTSFAQPPPRSPASFSSPLRSFQQGSYTNLDRRMSMPTNSLWQLAHQTTSQAPQTQTSPVAPHTDPRPRQHSMVDWRLGQTMPSRAAAQPANTLLADLDASQGMLSLRGQWATHSQGSDPSLDFGSEFQEDGRRGSYTESGLLAGTPTMYDPSGRRASVDSNATQPGSVLGDGMKKHACPLCQKKFTRPSSLQTHMYSHTGEKPFKCEFDGCGRSFSVVSNLRRHKKIHMNSNGR